MDTHQLPALQVTWQCGAKGRTLSSATERAPSFPNVCVGQVLTHPASLRISQELLGPGIKAQSLCFSLQSVSPAGASRPRTQRGKSGLLTPRRTPSPSPTSEHPTALQHWQSVQENPQCGTQRPAEQDAMHISMGQRGMGLTSLGELRCSQVGTRPGGAIQGH